MSCRWLPRPLALAPLLLLTSPDSGNTPSRGKYISHGPHSCFWLLLKRLHLRTNLRPRPVKLLRTFPIPVALAPWPVLLPRVALPSSRPQTSVPTLLLPASLVLFWVQPSRPSSRVSRRAPVDVPSPVSTSCSALPVRPSAARDLFPPSTPDTLSPCFPFTPPPLPIPSHHDLPSLPRARPSVAPISHPSHSPSHHKTSPDSLVLTSPPRAPPSVEPDPSPPYCSGHAPFSLQPFLLCSLSCPPSLSFPVPSHQSFLITFPRLGSATTTLLVPPRMDDRPTARYTEPGQGPSLSRPCTRSPTQRSCSHVCLALASTVKPNFYGVACSHSRPRHRRFLGSL